jgi:hypothetical protein
VGSSCERDAREATPGGDRSHNLLKALSLLVAVLNVGDEMIYRRDCFIGFAVSVSARVAQAVPAVEMN